MQNKRKKIWLIFGLTIVFVAFVFGMFVFVARLDNVSVQFRERLAQSETNLGENVAQKIKNDGQFDTGKSLLFYDLSENVAKIEKLNPFVKVEQTIKTFPNSLTIYISEREPCAYLKSGSCYFVFDNEFKVLDKFSSAFDLNDEQNPLNKYSSSCYEIKNITLAQTTEAGDFVKTDEINKVKSIHNGIIGALRATSLVKAIEFDENSYTVVMKKTLSTDDGTKIVIDGYNDLKEKTYVALKFYETIDKTQDAVVIKIYKDANGDYKAKKETN